MRDGASRLVASRPLVAAVTFGVTGAAIAVAAPAPTQITVWSATLPPSGLAYGGYPPTPGAMITEQRFVADATTPSGRQVTTYTAIYTW